MLWYLRNNSLAKIATPSWSNFTPIANSHASAPTLMEGSLGLLTLIASPCQSAQLPSSTLIVSSRKSVVTSSHR